MSLGSRTKHLTALGGENQWWVQNHCPAWSYKSGVILCQLDPDFRAKGHRTAAADYRASPHPLMPSFLSFYEIIRAHLTQRQSMRHTSIQKVLVKSSGRNSLGRNGTRTRAVSWRVSTGPDINLWLLDWKALWTVGGHSGRLELTAVY